MPCLFRSVHLRALLGYCLLAVTFAWPLPAHLGTRVLGTPGGDTGVYVWNLWVFRHELVTNHSAPLFTSTILSLDNRADLSLHNYTVFADLLGLPLIPLLGTVATFNLLYLLMIVINGYAMFLLARQVSGRAMESWLAGVLFAFAPCLVARSTAHFSLVMAAPIPLFLLLLHRLDRNPRWETAAAAGVVLSWAAFCDPYYCIYCGMLAAWHLASRCFGMDLVRRVVAGRAPGRIALDVLTGLVAVIVAWIFWTGGGNVTILGARIAMRTLYTPVLLLTILAMAQIAVRFRLHVMLRNSPYGLPLFRLAPYSVVTACALLCPLLYALGRRIADGRFVSPPVFWRSSMPGVDLLSFVLPNPNHPWFSGFTRSWVTHRPGGFEENVASLTFVALFVIGFAAFRLRARMPRYWILLAVVFAALAAGPFLRFAGVMTYVPSPWAIARYLPVVSSARAPARFMAVAMTAIAVLFALGLGAMCDRSGARRKLVLALASAAMLFELLPAPRVLYSAEMPSIYGRIATDPRDVRVLELPFGVRDGLMSAGNFSAASQFYQTFHHKRLIGGYLSRVSSYRVASMRRRPILAALMQLSEGRAIPPDALPALRSVAPDFLRAARLGYVVIDRERASAELEAFAVDVLHLEKIGEAGNRVLYRPVSRGSDILALLP